jgi:hypothetical protein
MENLLEDTKGLDRELIKLCGDLHGRVVLMNCAVRLGSLPPTTIKSMI